MAFGLLNNNESTNGAYITYFIRSQRFARRISNFFRIPLTFKNWVQLIKICLSVYITHSTFPPVVAFLRKGPKLKIRFQSLQDIGTTIETYQRMVYFPRFLRLCPNPTIIDVGASIGDFSVYCATFFHGSRIFSYEPTKGAYILLNENIRLNCLGKQIQPYQLAVTGAGNGDNKFGTIENFPNSISLEKILNENQITKCDLLKVDCEGAEYEIFFNTAKESLCRIVTISMECHIFDNGEMLGQLKNHLSDSGFTVTTTRISAANVCYLYATR